MVNIITRKTIIAITLLLLYSPTVLAAPKAYLNLINGTPYDWKLIDQHSYKMDWNPVEMVFSGTSTETPLKYQLNHHSASATATYRIGPPSNHESFSIHARQNPTRLEIQYLESLSSLNNPLNTLLNLGFRHNQAHPFILASNSSSSSSVSGSGSQNTYISTNPPITWMQSMLPSIGHLSLREITLPYSHDAGASEVTHSLGGPGTKHNTQTQYASIYTQLLDGMRVFDIRPMIYSERGEGEILTYHGTLALGRMWGATGQSMQGIVEDVNRFTREFPGELVILDVSHEVNRVKGYRGFDVEDWMAFYGVVGGIEDLWVEDEGEGLRDDLSGVGLEVFIKSGSKAAVLVRVPCEAPLVKKEGLRRRRNDVQTERERRNCPVGDLFVGDLALDITRESVPASLSSTLDFDAPSDTDTEHQPHTNTTTTLQRRNTFIPPGIIHNYRLPVTGSSSYTSSSSTLSLTQRQLLYKHKNTLPYSTPIHKSSWTITQPFFQQADRANWWSSILGYAVGAHRALYGAWGDFTGRGGVGNGDVDGDLQGRMPNWIEVDGVGNGDRGVVVLAMACNVWGRGG